MANNFPQEINNISFSGKLKLLGTRTINLATEATIQNTILPVDISEWSGVKLLICEVVFDTSVTGDSTATLWIAPNGGEDVGYRSVKIISSKVVIAADTKSTKVFYPDNNENNSPSVLRYADKWMGNNRFYMYVNDGTGNYPAGVQLRYNTIPSGDVSGTITFNFYE